MERVGAKAINVTLTCNDLQGITELKFLKKLNFGALQFVTIGLLVDKLKQKYSGNIP